MQQINLHGGIGDLVKNKTKSKQKSKKKNLNMLILKRKATDNNFKLKSGLKSSLGSKTSWNSRIIDSSLSAYNNRTKEDSNSS